jgi:glycosyltransferase involved in cell wall biosynthesis
MPPTVTHVTPYMHPDAGGPPVVVDRLCRRLVERGWTIRVVSTDSMSDPRDVEWQGQMRNRYQLDIHATKLLRGYAFSWSLGRALTAAAQTSDLMHLHTLWTYPTFVAARICRKLRVPFVVMPHGMIDPHSLERKRLKKWLYGHFIEWPNIRAARSMIYTHPEEQRLAETAVKRLPVGSIVPLGADEPPTQSRESQAEAFFQTHPHLKGKDVILFLGRLHPKKGLDLLIPAFSDVARANQNARLLLVGPSNEGYLRHLRHSIANLGLQDKVIFTGKLSGDSKWQAMAASDVFALPSYQENFALTVVEAMRMGLPVMLSRRVNIWEDVTGAAAGVDCELTSADVARQLLRLLSDRSLREASGRRGPQLVADKFHWDKSLEALEAVYRHLLCDKMRAACEPLTQNHELKA